MTFNASKAVKLANYETKLPAQMGYSLLQKKRIQKKIEKLRAIQDEVIQVHKEDIVRSVSELAFDEDINTRDRLKAFDLLCKICGFNAPEKTEIDITKQVIFQESIYDADIIDVEAHNAPQPLTSTGCQLVTYTGPDDEDYDDEYVE